jgi:hypothetical protein
MAWVNVQYTKYIFFIFISLVSFFGPKMRRGCNRLGYGTYASKGIFCARKATFRHRESKASKTPATLNCGDNSKMVLGRHLHSCSRSTDEETGVLSRKKLRRTVPRRAQRARVVKSRANRRLFARLLWPQKGPSRGRHASLYPPKSWCCLSWPHRPTADHETARSCLPFLLVAHLFVFWGCKRRHRARHDAAQLKRGTK